MSLMRSSSSGAQRQTFSGLTSRCAQPCACRWASALLSCPKSRLAWNRRQWRRSPYVVEAVTVAKLPYESPRLLLSERTAAPLDRPQHVATVEELELQADLGGRAQHAEQRGHVWVRGELMQRLHLSTHHREHLSTLAQHLEAHHLERDAGAPPAPRGDVHLGRLALAQEAANIKGHRQAGGLLHRVNAQEALCEPLIEPLLAVQLAPQVNHKGPRVLGGGLGRRTQHPKRIVWFARIVVDRDDWGATTADFRQNLNQ